MPRRSWNHPIMLPALLMALAATAFLPIGCSKRDREAEKKEPYAPAFIQAMNEGKAYLENRDSQNALLALQKAVKLHPDEAAAWRNLARAHLLARDAEAALTALGSAVRHEPDSAAAHYLTGLAHIRQTRFAEAIEPMEKAIRLDARTAALRYQLASAYQATNAHDKAREQLRETLRLDPLHGSAHFKLAAYARQAGDTSLAGEHSREFARLRAMFGEETRTPEALELCDHTLAESWSPDRVSATLTQAPPAIDVHFVEATSEVFPMLPGRMGSGHRTSALAVLEMDDRGRYTLVSITPGGVMLLVPGDEGWMPLYVSRTWPTDMCIEEAVVGDFHNPVPEGEKYDPQQHARNDLLLTGPDGVRLLRRSGAADFEDITEQAGLAAAFGGRGRWVDFDHDGDLDLLIVGARGVALWQNNGDATFREVTTEVGLAGDAGAVDAASVDLAADVAVDLIVAHGEKPTRLWRNQRTGRFAQQPEPPGPWPAATRVLADDFTGDGRAEALVIAGNEALVLDEEGARLVALDLGDVIAHAAATIDFDNDGRLDLLVAGAATNGADHGVLRLFRNESSMSGGAAFKDVTRDTGLHLFRGTPIRQLLTIDVDADGDSDILLLTSEDALRVLRNDGGNAQKQLKLRLSTIKTNPTGLGTVVEARAGAFLVSRIVTGVPVELGLGPRDTLDTLRTVWTNGVVDNQLNVTVTTAPMSIVEKNVATGSCPLLYAWDGERFRFVTDLLGNAPVGLPLTREELLPADPDEFVEVGDARSLVARDGRYLLQITDEFREIAYIDQTRLVAVDHPPGSEIHPTDKLMFPPFPPSELWMLINGRVPRVATGDDGIDRTAALAAIDGDFAPPGPPLPPPYRGMCHPMTLTMDFGAIDAGRPNVLALTGWLQYGDGSTNIALSQDRSLTILPPFLEVETADGRWHKVDTVVGMPAGKTKTILVDLADKLPADARRLRLTTTFEIRWDRIALLERFATTMDNGARFDMSAGAVESVKQKPAIRELPLVEADLQWRGFSYMAAPGPGHPTIPDHDKVFPAPPWRTTLEGWCTRYGPVRELVESRDGSLVILNAGDALTLAFEARELPDPPEGWRRTFFFFSVGWDKDGDHHVVDGDRVEPLPFEPAFAPADDDPMPDWILQYNTRFVPRDRFRDP